MSKTKRAMMASRGAREDIVTFFKGVQERRFSDAERALEAVKEKRFGNSDFKAGYLNALDGILLSSRSGDQRDFLNKASMETASMERYNRELGEFVKEGIHTPFDVGYFSAWSDFLHFQLNSVKKRQA
jgi:hypothetical protein